MRSIGLVFALLLFGCSADGLEGTYHADDGEGSRITITLAKGTAEIRQGNAPTVAGTYRKEKGRVVISVAGRDLIVTEKGGCLFPADDPSQTICKVP